MFQIMNIACHESILIDEAWPAATEVELFVEVNQFRVHWHASCCCLYCGNQQETDRGP
jgi:hypothetical protein